MGCDRGQKGCEGGFDMVDDSNHDRYGERIAILTSKD